MLKRQNVYLVHLNSFEVLLCVFILFKIVFSNKQFRNRCLPSATSPASRRHSRRGSTCPGRFSPAPRCCRHAGECAFSPRTPPTDSSLSPKSHLGLSSFRLSIFSHMNNIKNSGQVTILSFYPTIQLGTVVTGSHLASGSSLYKLSALSSGSTFYS